MRHQRPAVLTTGDKPGVTLWGGDGAQPPEPKSVDAEVDCNCWCEKSVLKVPLSLVRDGGTLSCGRSGCGED